MKKIKTDTRKLAYDAVLAAMCAVLGYVSLDFNNLKLSLEDVPIILGALLFGPVDAMAIGGVGTLIYQLLRYGVSATTLLWMLPYVLCGLGVGIYGEKKDLVLRREERRDGDPPPDRRELAAVFAVAELSVTAMNTLVLYLDARIYGYYSFVFIFGTLPLRLAISVVRALVYAVALPALLLPLRKAYFRLRRP